MEPRQSRAEAERSRRQQHILNCGVDGRAGRAGSGFNRRIDRVVRMISNRSVFGAVSGIACSVSTIRSAIVVRQRFFGIIWPLFLAGFRATPTSSQRNTSGRAGWKPRGPVVRSTSCRRKPVDVPDVLVGDRPGQIRRQKIDEFARPLGAYRRRIVKLVAADDEAIRKSLQHGEPSGLEAATVH